MPTQCPNCGKSIPKHSPQALCPACLLADNPTTEASVVEENASPAMMHGQFKPGHVLEERYRIVSLLGKGGMGEVYRADDFKLRQGVALKMLPEALAGNERQLEALYNEVRQARRVSHRHVCRVHDVGEAEGRPFLSMEFIDGENLGSLIRRIGHLPKDKAFQLGRQLCEGVEAGHNEGVLHLDLKPANLMIDKRGDLRVTDFGLARLTTDTNVDGRIAGTPAYMAPEQLLRGEANALCDVYAIGLILQEMLTGRCAMESQDLNAIRQFHRRGESIQTPAEWAPILQGCLAHDPASRTSTAAEICSRFPSPQSLAEQRPLEQPSSEPLSSEDVYLSYSPIDDVSPEVGKEGWISQFQRNLEVRLQQVSGESISVWKDPLAQEPVGNQVIEQLSDVRAMVSVLSPPAVKSARCRSEVEAFLDPAANSASRKQTDKLVRAVKHPVSEQDITPPFDRVLASGHGFEFFDRDVESGRICQFDESFGEAAKQRYQEKIYDLAFDLADLIRSGKNSGSDDSAETKGRVYLAPGTTDVQEAYDGIRRELLEDGYEVVPDESLPFELNELTQMIGALLAECDLAIHLVGKNYGFIPENGTVSAVELQNQLATVRSKEVGLKRIVWMHEDSVLSEGPQLEFVRQLQEDQEANLGAELVRGHLSAFKELVTARLQPPVPPEVANSSSSPIASSTSRQVYLICDRADESAVEVVEDYLFDQGADVFTPDFEADSQQFASQHQTNLARCDAVIIYYGAARKAWVDIMLSDVLKAKGYGRQAPVEHQAVYVAPPFDRRKERFRAHSVRVIKQLGESFESNVELEAFVSSIRTP